MENKICYQVDIPVGLLFTFLCQRTGHSRGFLHITNKIINYYYYYSSWPAVHVSLPEDWTQQRISTHNK